VRRDEHAEARVHDEDEEEEGDRQVDGDRDRPILLRQKRDAERFLILKKSVTVSR
jgi:hypothetical protein